MADGVIDQGVELIKSDISLFIEDRFISSYVENFPYGAAGFWVKADKFALKCNGKFIKHRSICKFSFACVQIGSGDFPGFVIS